TKEPSHSCFECLATCYKSAMLAHPFGITNYQTSRINKADASTGPISPLQIDKHWDHPLCDQRNKPRIAHQTGKLSFQMHLNVLRVIRFERSILRLVKMNEKCYHFTWSELACTLSLLACC